MARMSRAEAEGPHPTDSLMVKPRAPGGVSAADALTAIVRCGEALTPSMLEAAARYGSTQRWPTLGEAADSILYRAGLDTEASAPGQNGRNRWTRLLDEVEALDHRGP